MVLETKKKGRGLVNFWKQMLLRVLCCCCVFKSYGQIVFPVYVQSLLYQPTIALSDFQTATVDKYKSVIVLTDFTHVNLHVRLRLHIKGPGALYMRSKESFVHNQMPYVLSPGAPLVLGSSSELKSFFDPKNIDLAGIKATDLNNLPDGVYSFQLEVIDFYTGRTISNQFTGAAFTTLLKSDPPILLTPLNNTVIDPSNTSNILFTWMPRHVNHTSYKIELFEMDDPNENPNYSIQKAPWVLFEQELDGNSKHFNYTVHNSLLREGKRYAWRIRAQNSGTSASSYFKNQGYSEVFSFYYSKPCPKPKLIEMDTCGPGKVRVSWTSNSAHTAYELTYNRFMKNDHNTVVSSQPLIVLEDLEPENRYEFNVSAVCDAVRTPTNYLGTIKTSVDEGLSCAAPQRIEVKKAGADFTFEWEHFNDARSFIVNYRRQGNADWLSTEVDENKVTLTLPLEMLKAEVRIDAWCNDGSTQMGEVLLIDRFTEGFVGQCSVPKPLVVLSQVDSSKATLSWNSLPEHQAFAIKYASLNVKDPVHYSIPSFNERTYAFQLPEQIIPGVRYKFMIDFYCKNGSTSSAWRFIEFTPPDQHLISGGDCFPPVGVISELVAKEEVKILWDKMENVKSYEILYRLKNSNNEWQVAETRKTEHRLTNLQADTIYEVEIRSLCSDGGRSIHSKIHFFNTDTVLFARNCPDISELELLNNGKNHLELSWNTKAKHKGVLVGYKTEQQDVLSWNSKELWSGERKKEKDTLMLTGLWPGKTYHVRAHGICGNGRSIPTRVYSFETRPKQIDSAFICQTSGVNCKPSALPLSANLLMGDHFAAADFDVEVKKAQRKGDSFFGEGTMVVPYMDHLRVGVKFRDLQLAGNYCATDGKVWVTNANINVLGNYNPQEIIDIILYADSLINSGMDFLNFSSNLLQVLQNFGGQPDTSSYEDFTYTQALEQGIQMVNQLVTTSHKLLDSDFDLQDLLNDLTKAVGLINYAAELANQLGVDLKALDATENYKVNFKALNSADLYFDEYTNKGLSGFYEQVKTADNRIYFVPYVAIDKGGKKRIKAKINIPHFDETKLSFVSKSSLSKIDRGIKQALEKHKLSDGLYELIVPSNAECVYAVYNNDKGEVDRIGKIKVVEISEINKKVYIVPFEERTMASATEIETGLKKIFKVAGVKFDVEILPAFAAAATASLQIDEHKIMSRYSQDMMNLEDAYFLENVQDADAVYLFIVAGIYDESGKRVSGYMPRNKEIGFLSPGPSIKTIAHELGHGVFTLAHTWDVDVSQPPASTDNLMDYKTDTAAVTLLGAQWLQIQDPSFAIYGLDKVRDAALLSGDTTFNTPIGRDVKRGDVVSFGPINVEMKSKVKNAECQHGVCQYNVDKVKFGLDFKDKFIGDYHKELNLGTLKYSVRESTGALIAAKISWQRTSGGTIKDLGLIDANITQVDLSVDSTGAVNGKVYFTCNMMKDKVISSLLTVKKGAVGDFNFEFKASSKELKGQFDLKGLTNINLELRKGKQVLATLVNGEIDSAGYLTGHVSMRQVISYQERGFDLELHKLEANIRLHFGNYDFEFDSILAEGQVGKLPGLKKVFKFEISHARDALRARISEVDSLELFGLSMNVDALFLFFNDQFELTKIYGQNITGQYNRSIHQNRLEGKFDIKKIEIRDGKLSLFKGQGVISYEPYTFINITNGNYNEREKCLSFKAELDLDAGGNTNINSTISGIKIFQNGDYEIAKVNLDAMFNLGPVTIEFDGALSIGNDTNSVKATLRTKVKEGSVDQAIVVSGHVKYLHANDTSGITYLQLKVDKLNLEFPEVYHLRTELQALDFRYSKTWEAGVAKESYSGRIELSPHLTEDVFVYKKLIRLRKGVEGTLSYVFDSEDHVHPFGVFDLSELKKVYLEILSENSRKQEVIVAELNATIDKSGLASGSFKVKEVQEIESNNFSLKVEKFDMNASFHLKTNEYKLISGDAKILLNKIKGLEGTVVLEATCKDSSYLAKVVLSNQKLKVCNVELKELALEVALDEEFNLTKITGGFSLQHQDMEQALIVNDVLIEDGQLKSFDASGKFSYKQFDVDVSGVAYLNDTIKINASLRLGPSYVTVKGFSIAPDGTMHIDSASGAFDKGLVELEFRVAFKESRFYGDFEAFFGKKFGLQGTVDMGSRAYSNGKYNFGYYALNLHGNIPIFPGISISQLGGRFGYNYHINFDKVTKPPGFPSLGEYSAGFSFGLSDNAQLIELAIDPAICQWGGDQTSLSVSGTLKAPKQDPIINAQVKATLDIPSYNFYGNLKTNVNIPASSGSIFKSNTDFSFKRDSVLMEVESNEISGTLLNALIYKGNFSYRRYYNNDGDFLNAEGRLNGQLSFGFHDDIESRGTLLGEELWSLKAKLDFDFEAGLNCEFNEKNLNVFYIAGSIKAVATLDVNVIGCSLKALAAVQGEAIIKYENKVWFLASNYAVSIQADDGEEYAIEGDYHYNF